MINKIVHAPTSKLQQRTQLPNLNPDRSPSLNTPQEVILTNGSKFTLVTTTGGLVKDSLYLNRDDWWKVALDKTEKFQRISSQTLVAGNPGFQNYYHWTYQIWSTILFAQSERKDLSSLNVLGPPLNAWRRKYIDLLGNGINYIESDTNCAYFLDAAYWSDVMHGSYSFNPSASMLQLLENFGNRFHRETPARIYISRRDTPRRGVFNEDELELAVSKRGFTSVLLSELPLTQQISILRGADFIIAPHGAGLTNIVFCGKKKKLIELMPDDYFNQCFRAIASVKEFNYIGIINPSTADVRGYHFSQINVDIKTLNSAIDEMEKI